MRGTPINSAEIVSLRDGGYMVFDTSHESRHAGMERVPVFACGSKDDLLDYLEKRLADPPSEEEGE
ncbi:MAG: hypothetical protein J0I54_17795 [Bosea sp.]|uniref:hypothetical protein n=1 Tax=unclassified Bosea (in: a-proteobacteria) TaxID=2653178 RepID=UPI000968755A|nr:MULTISPECIES: hypothetical protein [unclassified Bosea (in: a-proteobacteria)]MBN9458487.1 hypothetical protein [Bosea sp. (in: a-proteobacteria)]OJV06811.1 MAG: hypothetical protein BGO20_00150 [Bosea sp. 67-29]